MLRWGVSLFLGTSCHSSAQALFSVVTLLGTQLSSGLVLSGDTAGHPVCWGTVCKLLLLSHLRVLRPVEEISGLCA